MSLKIQRRIRRVAGGDQFKTTVELFGVANIRIQISGSLNPQQRRAITLTFLRQIRPWLQYFRGASLHHWGSSLGSSSGDFRREEERGLSIFSATSLDDPRGRLGFKIRMRRLELGMTQAELAETVGLNRSHLSEIEMGRSWPHLSTLRCLESALQIPLPETRQTQN